MGVNKTIVEGCLAKILSGSEILKACKCRPRLRSILPRHLIPIGHRFGPSRFLGPVASARDGVSFCWFSDCAY